PAPLPLADEHVVRVDPQAALGRHAHVDGSGHVRGPEDGGADAGQAGVVVGGERARAHHALGQRQVGVVAGLAAIPAHASAGAPGGGLEAVAGPLHHVEAEVIGVVDVGERSADHVGGATARVGGVGGAVGVGHALGEALEGVLHVERVGADGGLGGAGAGD